MGGPETPHVGPYTVSGATRRRELPGEHFLLLSEGSDAGTPILMSQGTDLGTGILIGEIYE